MTDKFLDEKIKSALENFEVPFDASTWDALSAKMDAVANPVPVDAVDKVVARGLQHLEPAFQPAQWKMLETQMRAQTALRHRIYGSKLAEAAIFLLLLWNLGHLAGLGRSEEKRATPAVPAKPKFQGPVAENRKGGKIRPSENPPEESGQAGVLAGANFSEIGTDGLLPGTGQVFEGENLTTENGLNPALAIENTGGFSGSNLTKGADNEAFANIQPEISGMPAAFAALAFLPSKSPGVLEHPKKDEPQFASLAVKKKREKTFYVSNYAAIARNHVQTPYDENFQKEGYANWSGSGYGGGLAAGIRRGKWGAEAGIVYASKRYSPRKTTETFGVVGQGGRYATSLAAVDFDVVSVPVSATRRVAKFGKTDLRARAGVAANMVAQSAYTYQTREIPWVQPKPGDPPIAAQPTFRETGTGILEGGSFSKNSWLTAEAGLRIERTVGQGFTAFVEPVFSMAVAGRVGPKRDKIGGVALQAGVLTRI